MLYTKPAVEFQTTCSLHEVSGSTCGLSDVGCQHAPYVEAAERGLQDGLRSSVGYTVKGSTTVMHYPVIDDIDVTLYTKPAVAVQTTCSVYEVSGSAYGQSDLDYLYTQYA